MSTITLLSDDDRDDILISCRYGDLEEIQQFVTKFGRSLLSDVRDENGNSVLHMTAGNGHTGKLLSLAYTSSKKKVLIHRCFGVSAPDHIAFTARCSK